MTPVDRIPRWTWPGAALFVLLSGCAAMPAPIDRAPPSALPTPSAPAGRSPLYGAESAFARGDLAMARAHLAALADHSVPITLMPRLQLLRARLAAAEGRDADVLRLLPAEAPDAEVMASSLALRAEALQRLGQPVAAVRAWVDRLPLLPDALARDDNRDRLWQGLLAARLGPADRLQAAGEGFVVEGWFALALAQQQADRDAAMAQWRAQFGPHPASDWMASGGLQSALSAMDAGLSFAAPAMGGHWAVLLPQSGPLSATAAAIRDGWMAAYLQAGLQVPVRFYDTGGHAEGAVRAYRTALQDGAALLIGPLHKDSVSAVVAAGPLPVPMIALNQMERGAYAANLLQFGLAPEDEARAAAEQAASAQWLRVVMLLPDGNWGDRIGDAFERALAERGGAVLDRRRYAPGTSDFSDAIKDLMRVSDSESRYRELVNVLGTRPVFEARRRGDIDMVFFAGRPVDGRQIWSQFRFHRAQDLPAFATAAVHDPQQGAAGDLIGTRFCDQPWLIEPQRTPAWVRGSALTARDSQPRLFAMGVDALALAQSLGRGPLTVLDGMTGRLSLGADGRVQRDLACALITTRGLEPLPAPSAAENTWSDSDWR